MIYIVKTTNVTLHNGVIVGDRKEHKCEDNKTLLSTSQICPSGSTHQGGIGVEIVGSVTVTVKDMYIRNMIGDGILVDDHDEMDKRNKDITIRDNYIYKCRRNAITLSSGEKIVIKGNHLHDIKGVNLQVAIDLEPKSGSNDQLTDITIDNNEMYNLSSDLHFAIKCRGSSSQVKNITVQNNKMDKGLSICHVESNGKVIKGVQGNLTISKNKQGTFTNGVFTDKSCTFGNANEYCENSSKWQEYLKNNPKVKNVLCGLIK